MDGTNNYCTSTIAHQQRKHLKAQHYSQQSIFSKYTACVKTELQERQSPATSSCYIASQGLPLKH